MDLSARARYAFAYGETSIGPGVDRRAPAVMERRRGEGLFGGLGIGPVGFQLPKPAWLQRQTGGDLHYDELRLDEMATRHYGECAVTTARWNARGTAQGHPVPEATRITLITVKDQGDWRLAGIHFSFIAGTPGSPAGPGPS